MSDQRAAKVCVADVDGNAVCAWPWCECERQLESVERRLLRKIRGWTSCENYHHEVHQLHKGFPCPVEAEIDALLAQPAPTAPSSPGDKNYRRLLEESNLPIELAVEIADKIDQLQRELAEQQERHRVLMRMADARTDSALSATPASPVAWRWKRKGEDVWNCTNKPLPDHLPAFYGITQEPLYAAPDSTASDKGQG